MQDWNQNTQPEDIQKQANGDTYLINKMEQALSFPPSSPPCHIFSSSRSALLSKHKCFEQFCEGK